jgi:hypothetical protein
MNSYDRMWLCGIIIYTVQLSVQYRIANSRLLGYAIKNVRVSGPIIRRCVCHSGFLPLYNGTRLTACIDPIIQAGSNATLGHI